MSKYRHPDTRILNTRAVQARIRYRHRMVKSRRDHIEGCSGKLYGYVYVIGMGDDLCKIGWPRAAMTATARTIIGMGDSLCKIGWTLNVHKRLKAFRTGNPLVMLVHAEHVTDAHHREKVLHRRFKQQKVYGEWYRLSNIDIAAIKEYLAKFTPPMIPDSLAYLNTTTKP